MQELCQVVETLIAVKGNRVAKIPRSAVIEVLRPSTLPSFTDVLWKGEVYAVRRVDVEMNTVHVTAA